MAADPWAAFQEVKPKDDPWAGFEDLGQAPPEVNAFNLGRGVTLGARNYAQSGVLGAAQSINDFLRTHPSIDFRRAYMSPGQIAGIDPQFQQQRHALDVSNAGLMPDIQSPTGRAAYSGVQSFLSQAPLTAAGVLTGTEWPALAAMGANTFGEAYGRYRQRGATPGQAGLGAGIEGVTEVATEKLPMSYLVGKFGKAGFSELFAGLLAREIPTEMLATAVQSASDAAIANPNMTLGKYLDNFLPDQRDTIIATLTQTLITGGLGAGATKLLRGQAGQPGPQNLNAAQEQFRQNAGLGQPVTDLTATPPPGGNLGAPQLEGPPGSIRPPAPDFVVDPYGRAVRPGEALPEDRALPAPQPSGEWQVTPAGVVSPITQTQAQGLGQARQERADLGLGQADRLQYQAEQNRANPPQAGEAMAVTPTGAVMPEQVPGTASLAARRGRVDVAAAIAPVVQRWGANAPGLNIVENASQLPDAVRSQVGEDVLGATDLGTGQVYLNSALIHSPEEAQRVLAHEAVGHYGMQRMLGERWGTVLGEVANLAKTQPELAKIAEGVTRDYPGVDADTHAAEVIGRFAETNPQHPFVKRVVAWLREALRNMGFAVKLSHNDLVAMLRRAAKYNEGGGVIGTTIKDGVLAMTVYHGSPHNFDAFDMSKIGTGEGAQAYGHGLYVAENPNVAKEYAPLIPAKYVTETGAEYKPPSGYHDAMLNLVSQYGTAEKALDAIGPNAPEVIKETLLDMIKSGVSVQPARRSNVYHVDLPDSHIANMLDWDAPLSQQPEKIQAALRSQFRVVKELDSDGPWVAYFGDQSLDAAKTRKELIARFEAQPGKMLTQEAGMSRPEREAISNRLNSLGIPGIKYWDGGSRAAGNGTRNYVVFDDKILTITHKNGEPVTPKERSQILAARPEGMSRQSTATGTNAPQQQPESPPWAGASQSTVNEAGKLETGGGTYSMAPVSGLDPGAQQALLDVMSADTGQSRVARQRGNGGEPVTWAMNGQAAQVLLNSKLGPLYRDLVNRVPHTAANAAKMEALSSFVVAQGQRLWEAQQRYNQTGAHEDLVRVMAEGEKLAMLQAPMMGYWTEAGRSLNIIRKVQQETANARALLDALGDGSEGAARAFSERLKGARTVADVLNVTKAAYQPNALDMFREFWINGLLSGPWTHVVNTVSNSLYMGLESGARLATSVVSPNVSTRAELARFSGWLAGANLGIANAAKAFMTEEPQLSGTRQIDSPKMRAIPGEVGRLVRVPGRALMAMDEFAKAVNYTGALHEMAMEEAIKRNPANPHEVLGSILAGYANDTAAQDKAKAFADRMTFQTQLGEHGRSLMAAREKVPGAWAIVPFVRTPTNIVKEFAKFTPAGAAMPSVIADLKSGNAKARDLAIGRMAVGTAIMGTVAALTAAGMITGAGPDDPRERELWLRTGRLPYAFKNPITGEWQRYNRFEPFAMLVGISADLSEISREFGREDKTALQKAEAAGNLALGSFMTNLGDKTFLRGVTDFSQMVSDPTRFAGQWASGMAGTLIPNILAQGARIDDPYLRDARGIVDSLRSRVPGARESLPHKLDIAGEPIQGSRFEPSASSAPRNDPLAEAMLAVGAIKGSPGRSITLQGHRYDLTSEEYEDYKAFLQQTRWAVLTPVAASPQFKALARNDSLKAKDLLERQWDKIGSEARDIWLVRHPEVIRKIASQRVTPEGSSYLNQ